MAAFVKLLWQKSVSFKLNALAIYNEAMNETRAQIRSRSF